MAVMLRFTFVQCIVGYNYSLGILQSFGFFFLSFKIWFVFLGLHFVNYVDNDNSRYMLYTFIGENCMFTSLQLLVFL